MYPFICLAVVGETGATEVYPTAVGEVAPCNVGHNVMYLHGNDFIQDGLFETPSETPWEVFPGPSNVSFEVGGFTPDRFIGKFSAYHLQQPLVPGLYEDAVREGFEESGQPGIAVYGRGGGCNIMAGRFQVHELTDDAVTGAIQSATISFEQSCDPEPDFTGNPTVKLMVGCFHYSTY